MYHSTNYIIMLLAALALLAPLTQAYQTMRIPTPLRHMSNQHRGNATGDNYTLPLTPAQFPCKGYMSNMMNDPLGIGSPVTTYRAGSNASIYLTGQSLGGSGQISMSGNNGSLTVIHSFEGSVGIKDSQELTFVFPADAPLGTVVLSFTYFPLESTEVYQSCAAVELFAPRDDAVKPTIPFTQRPDIFVSDLKNGCIRDATRALMFPNRGSDFTMNHNLTKDLGKPTLSGNCTSVNRFGNGAKANAKGVNFPAPAEDDEEVSPSSQPSAVSSRPQSTRTTASQGPGSTIIAHPNSSSHSSASRPTASSALLGPGEPVLPRPSTGYPSSAHSSIVPSSTMSHGHLTSSIQASASSVPYDRLARSEPAKLNERYSDHPTNHSTASGSSASRITLSGSLSDNPSTRNPSTLLTSTLPSSPPLATQSHRPLPSSSQPSTPSNTTRPAHPISTDGRCGMDAKTRCPDSFCCSGFGFCGETVNYCGSFTCVKGFGSCSVFDNGTDVRAVVKERRVWMGRFGRRGMW